MILHFLRRDFKDFLLYWIIVSLVTIIALFAGVVGLPMLFWVYFMFPSIAEGYILGSQWRTQHQMSRHYLLGLPIPHKRLFVIQQLRMLVFWLPLLILASFMPFTVLHPFKVGFFYYFALLVSVALCMHSQMWSGLEMENISTYLPKGYRLWAYSKFFVVLIGTMMVLWLGWANFLSNAHSSPLAGLPRQGFLFLMTWFPAHIVFPIAFIVLVFWIPYNARRWCVTL